MIERHDASNAKITQLVFSTMLRMADLALLVGSFLGILLDQNEGLLEVFHPKNVFVTVGILVSTLILAMDVLSDLLGEVYAIDDNTPTFYAGFWQVSLYCSMACFALGLGCLSLLSIEVELTKLAWLLILLFLQLLILVCSSLPIKQLQRHVNDLRVPYDSDLPDYQHVRLILMKYRDRI